MKILFLLHSSGVGEGSSIAALFIMSRLKAKGYDVQAVCPKQGDIIQKLSDIDVKTTIIRYGSAIYPKIYTIKSLFSWPKRLLELLWYNHNAEKKLEQFVKTYKPDVIHTNVGVLRVGYYVAKKLRIPHVWHIRETYQGYPNFTYQKRLYWHNRFNITITNAVKNFYSLSDSNTKVVYDGVFSESIQLLKDVEKKNYFLFVGRLIQYKGADWAVDAFLKIANAYPSYELWLAGSNESPFAKDLKQKLKEDPISKRIKFLGARSDIYNLISSAQAVLVPSVREGFGFVPVEAMLNRTLVIGRNTAGVKEQFDNGVKYTGKEIALRCDTVDDMARYMADICRNGQDYYLDMIDRAEKLVRDLYTIENNVNEIVKIYKKIVI